MLKRLLVALASALLLIAPAIAQIPGGDEIAINRTPVIGGTPTQCLFVTSANKVGNQACGAGTAANVTVGTTTVTGGTTGRVLYDNAGVLGEMTNTGTGTVSVLQTSPSLITPVLGVATGMSLALGGATIGTDALAVTGSVTVSVGSNSSIKFFQNPSFTAFGGISLNGVITDAGVQGFFGGSNGDHTLYFQSQAGINFRAGGNSTNYAMDGSGNFSVTSTLKTAAPAGASAGSWKLGSLVTAAVVLDTTRSVFIDIGGTVYKLLVAQ